MKKLLLTVVIHLFLLGVIQPTHAQEKSDAAILDDLAAKAMALAQPGEEHQLLEKLTGEWNFETKMWMSPGAEPAIFPGTAGAKMVLGDRFLYGEFKTEAGAMTGEGIYIIGFDRRHEKFTYVGFDTWGTYSVSADGTYDEEAGRITLYGEDYDPVMGHTQKYDFVITIISDDSWRFEVIFYDKAHTKGADQFKMVEVNYTRAE